MELKKSCPIKKRRSLRHGKKEIPSEDCAKFNNKIQTFNRSKSLIYAVSTDKIRISLKFGFADDCIIFAKSERAAHRIYESISKYIEKKLFLQINKEKTSIGMLSPRTKFLGFGFKRIEEDLETRWVPVVHNKSRKKLKDKIRILTDRRLPRGEKSTKERFNTFLTGWVGYYRIGMSNCSFTKIDEWIRRRIRQIYLKMWKKNRTKYEELKKLKRNKDELCCAIAHSSMKYWAKALYANYVITKEVIRNWGWLSVKEAYEKGFIDCDLSEPPTA